MRGGWTTGLVLVLLSACTRPNAAFDEPTEGDPTGSVATSAATSVAGSEGSETRASTAGDTTLDYPDDGWSTQGNSGPDGPMDSGPGCELDFRDSYGFESDPTLAMMFRNCPDDEMTLRILGSNFGNLTQFTGHRCPPEECTCPEEFPISLTFEVPLPELDGCFDLVFQLEPESCKVLAYKIVPPSGGLPLAIVSNVVTPSFDLPMTVDLGVPPSSDCSESCDRPPGHYGLDISGRMEIPPDGTPVPVQPYYFVNDGSGIHVGCEEVGRWHAE